ncbi:DUF4382 domain-containing protein [Bacteroidota bacterium]
MIIKAALIFFALFVIIGCSDNDNPVEVTDGSGRLKIYLGDSPASFDSVVVCISRVEIHKSGSDSTSGWSVINDSSRYFDLLQLMNGASVVLGDTSLTEGRYTQIRLIIEDGSYVIDTGIKHALTIPSGYQTGIKLNHSFDIERDNLYELLLDFNVDKSILVTGNGEYKLKPTIRVIPLIISGSISGKVLPLDADPVISTISGTDTVSTFSNEEGLFKLVGLLEGFYDVTISPTNPTFKDSTITGVQVVQNEDTDLGTITLQSN